MAISNCVGELRTIWDFKYPASDTKSMIFYGGPEKFLYFFTAVSQRDLKVNRVRKRITI